MPNASINGVSIHYKIHGSGFPLVLAYGLGGSTNQWAPQVEAFSQRFQLIIWDPRGHGKSESPPLQSQYGMQTSADDLYELLNHLAIDRAYVGGLSMGAGIAVRFTVAHPERVAALLVIDSTSASGLPTPDDMRAMRLKTIELAETKGMEAVADYAIKANPNLSTQAQGGAEALQSLRQMYLDLDPMGYTNTIRAMLEHDFTTESLRKIKAPTLVLAGEQDPSRAPAYLTHTKIQGSEYVVIPGAGHLSNLDKPQQFNDHILDFLRKVESQARV